MLTDLDKQILDFERRWWKYAGAKEQGIRAEFGMSGTRYYQNLHRIIHDPDAVAYDGMLVKRLQRIERRRIGPRDPRRLGLA